MYKINLVYGNMQPVNPLAPGTRFVNAVGEECIKGHNYLHFNLFTFMVVDTTISNPLVKLQGEAPHKQIKDCRIGDIVQGSNFDCIILSRPNECCDVTVLSLKSKQRGSLSVTTLCQVIGHMEITC